MSTIFIIQKMCAIIILMEKCYKEQQDNVTLLRYASVILHLNTVREGGELVFPEQNVKIQTEEGKLVVFPPYGMYGHYTTPSNETREVIVSWFVYNGINVVKTNT
jgi:hypothetical protein